MVWSTALHHYSSPPSLLPQSYYSYHETDGDCNNSKNHDLGRGGTTYIRSIQGEAGLPRSSFPNAALSLTPFGRGKGSVIIKFSRERVVFNIPTATKPFWDVEFDLWHLPLLLSPPTLCSELKGRKTMQTLTSISVRYMATVIFSSFNLCSNCKRVHFRPSSAGQSSRQTRPKVVAYCITITMSVFLVSLETRLLK